ncbi:hypothetical protein LP421_29960 (plasmid) [Rhizobium sp. RCAM05350]|nr:hypothetical protein LP421_29960 [Rhizobium sp. RCAM05350]
MTTLQDMFDVRDRSVIVTGGASRIGRAYAEVMADNGARLHFRHERRSSRCGRRGHEERAAAPSGDR